jgi:hypothetical protein
MSIECITEMLYLMMLLFASGNAGAAGLTHLPIMLLQSVASAFVCSSCVFKIKNLGVILILNCLTDSALAYTSFELCFLVVAWEVDALAQLGVSSAAPVS